MKTHNALHQNIYTPGSNSQNLLPKKDVSDVHTPKIDFSLKEMTDPVCLAHLGVNAIGRPIGQGTTASVYSSVSNSDMRSMVIKKVNSGGPDEFPEYFNEKLISDSLRFVFKETELHRRFIYIEGWSVARHNSNRPHLLFSMPMVPTTLENHQNLKSINNKDGIMLAKSLLESLKSAISKGFVPIDMNGGNIFFGNSGVMFGDFQKWGVIKNSEAEKQFNVAFQTIKNEEQYLRLEQHFRTYNLSEFPIYKNTENANCTIINQVYNFLNWVKKIPSIRKHIGIAQKHAETIQKQKRAASEAFSAIEYLDECLKHLGEKSANGKNDHKNKEFTVLQAVKRRLCFA